MKTIELESKVIIKITPELSEEMMMKIILELEAMANGLVHIHDKGRTASDRFHFKMPSEE